MATVTMNFLIDDLRFNIGDWVEPFTYTEDTLNSALLAAAKTLARKWRNRYRINASGNEVYRNVGRFFIESEPPVVMQADERIFIVQATIILKRAKNADSIWDIGSWRDDEIAYSNIASSKAVSSSIKADEEELEELLKGRLYMMDRQSLEGFKLPMNWREG